MKERLILWYVVYKTNWFSFKVRVRKAGFMMKKQFVIVTYRRIVFPVWKRYINMITHWIHEGRAISWEFEDDETRRFTQGMENER